MKRRADFLRCASRGRKVVKPAFILQYLHEFSETDSEIPVGYTASKKVGNAVIRNRLKRRLRAVCADLLPALATPGTAYVLIARRKCVQYPYDQLRKDLHEALIHHAN